MRTISIINQKGGTGKTTTTVSLGSCLAQAGKRVLLIDLDPQHSSTTWLAITNPGKGIFELFIEPEKTNLTSLIHETCVKNLSVIPSSSWLIGAEKALNSEMGAETILRDAIKRIDPKAFDYVLIDCAPTLGILVVNALTATEEIIVPVEAQVMSLNGLVQLLQTVEKVQKRLNSKLRITGIVACRFNQRTNHSHEVVEILRKRFPVLTYQTVIRTNIKLAECPSTGLPITIYAPDSPGAQDYQALAREVMEQEQTLAKEEYEQTTKNENHRQ